jgi:sugar phosphate isomerase/epimerase
MGLIQALAVAGFAAAAAIGQPEKAVAPGPAPAAHPPAAQPAAAPAAPVRDDSAAEKLGWFLAVQAWTFRDRTAFEAIDATKKLGVKYIELYPGQPLSPEKPTEKVGPEMSKELRDELKKKLAESGVKVMAFGVVNPTKEEAEVKKLFEFAKDLGIETITCEPAADAWDTVENMCYLHSVNAAVHNHPKPSKYWNPDDVAKVVKERAMRVGVCADTGHWARSGIKPVDALKKLRGRILSLHFKDIAGGEDKPWGEGDQDARGMLEELHRQGFRGVISLEYESGKGAELEANAAKCVAFFDKVAAEIAAK